MWDTHNEHGLNLRHFDKLPFREIMRNKGKKKKGGKLKLTPTEKEGKIWFCHNKSCNEGECVTVGSYQFCVKKCTSDDQCEEGFECRGSTQQPYCVKCEKVTTNISGTSRSFSQCWPYTGGWRNKKTGPWKKKGGWKGKTGGKKELNLTPTEKEGKIWFCHNKSCSQGECLAVGSYKYCGIKCTSDDQCEEGFECVGKEQPNCKKCEKVTTNISGTSRSFRQCWPYIK